MICIEDPLREEAKASVEALRGAGISKIVMMTGDSERTAAAIARSVGCLLYTSRCVYETAEVKGDENLKGEVYAFIAASLSNSMEEIQKDFNELYPNVRCV